MFQRILVALDGSKLAEGVLPYAEALARMYKAWVTLYSVVPHEASAGDATKEAKLVHELEQKASKSIQAYLHTIESRLSHDGINVDSAAKIGNAASNIVEFAHEGNYDLIAIATRGRSGFRRWMMGSVADHVIQTTSTPLLLIKPQGWNIPTTPLRLLRPDTWKTPNVATINTLIVPLDGSAIAESSIPFVEDLAAKSSLEVVLVQALPTLSQLYLGIEPQAFPTDVMKAVEESTTSYLKGMAEKLKSQGINARWESPMGDPASVILDAAKKHTNNIVVMSTRGRTGFARWILGSVADKVVRGAAGPVILIRPKQDEELLFPT